MGLNLNEWRNRQLPLHTGLYVHRAKKPGKSYCAVTAFRDGAENTHDVTAANSLAQPVEEVVAPGEAILYRVLSQPGWRPGDKIRETQFFVYWAAPPYANQPRRAVHITVGLHGVNPPPELVINYNIGDMYGSDLLRGTHANSWKGDSRIVAVVLLALSLPRVRSAAAGVADLKAVCRQGQTFLTFREDGSK